MVASHFERMNGKILDRRKNQRALKIWNEKKSEPLRIIAFSMIHTFQILWRAQSKQNEIRNIKKRN